MNCTKSFAKTVKNSIVIIAVIRWKVVKHE